MDGLTDQSFSIRQVVRGALAAMRANPVPIFGVPFLLGGVTRTLGLALAGMTPDDPRGVPDDAGMAMTSLIVTCLMLACVIHASVAHADARRARLGDCLKVAGKRLAPLLGVIVLYCLGVVIGSLLFLIPGLMLLMLWAVAIPVIVEERAGVFGAFGRSQELTRGARMQLFGLFLLLLLTRLGLWAFVVFLSRFVLGTQYGDFTVATKLVAIVFATLDFTIATAFWGTMLSAAFVELRNGKEGSPESRLNEIFA